MLKNIHVTKNGKVRWIPLDRSLRQLLEKMHAEVSEEMPEKPIMQVFECQKSIDRAVTRSIENGVDNPTVSRWLGHEDSGALCMKTYGHLRDEHRANEARRVMF